MSGTKKSYHKTSIGAPIFDKREINAVLRCLKEGRLSQGKYVQRFEKEFAKYIGTKYAVACNSGSSANLLIASVLKELYGNGGLVIVPAATFATTISPFLQTGFRVVCSDVSTNANIDPDELEGTIEGLLRKSNKAPCFLLAVHSLGIPCDMGKLQKIAKKHRLLILEDCCESHGAEYQGKRVGSFGLMSSFSFFVAHNMTSGEGGIVVTNNKKCYDLLRSFREFGRKIDPGRWAYSKHLGFYDERHQFDRLGFNFRMTDYTASFAIEQLKKLNAFNNYRRKIVGYYTKRLKKWGSHKSFFVLPEEVQGNYNTYYGYLIIIRENSPFTRKKLVQYLENRGIETRPFFAGFLPYQKAFEKKVATIGKCSGAKLLHKNSFFIGCHPGVSKKDAEYVCNILDEFLENYA